MNRLRELTAFSCGHCTYSTRHFMHLIHHYKGMHEFQRNFRVTCGIENCQKSYSIIRSYQSHILRQHQVFYKENISSAVNKTPIPSTQNCPSNSSQNNVTNDLSGNDSNEDRTDNYHHEPEENGDETCEPTQDFDFTQHLARFLLFLREVKKLPMNVCADIANEIENVMSVAQNETKRNLVRVLNENGLSVERLKGSDEILEGLQRTILACETLSSTKRQNAYFEKEFGFVEPVELVLGQDNSGRSDTMMYVPIKKNLQMLLSHEDVLAFVVSRPEAQNSKLRDFSDGHAFRSSTFFQSEHPILHIQLYVDDFQVSNPLGNKTKRYKVTGIYFILGNIPPQFRSKLYVIQLAALIRTELVKRYGLNKVMELLIADLKSLENEGVTVTAGSETFQLRGTVSMLVADNLAAHEMSGMMESFVAGRICRFCTASRTGIQENFKESDFQLRSSASYDAAVRVVEGDPTMAKVYGIKSNSALNKLDQYHICWGVPSDIAHDIFEGFGVDFLEFSLRRWVELEFLTFQQLSDLIESFQYSGSDKASRPTKTPTEQSKFRVKQTASQAWCLLRLLPVIIGHLIPDDDSLWTLYINLLDIIDLVCAPVISTGHVAYLRLLITAFLEAYFEINSETTVKPKAHYLVHYPSEILRFGPLVHCWTLRFEGKHQYFKETIGRSKNHRNVCKTMARRHQFLQAYHHASPSFLSQDSVSCSNGSTFPVRLLSNDVQRLIAPLVDPNENVYQAKSVNIDGVLYESGCAVITEFDHDSYQFGRIESCFVIGGNVHLLLKKLRTEEYCTHFHAYTVSESQEFSLRLPGFTCKLKSLEMPYKYHVTVSEEQKDVIELEDKANLPAEVFKRFNIETKPYVIQMWDVEFEDWCVVSLTQLPDKAKLRFIVVDTLAVTSPMSSNNSNCPESTTTESHTDCDAEATRMAVNESPVVLTAPMRQWPVQFLLPFDKFPRSLRDALQQQKPIVGALLSQLTTAIYEEMTKYTFYPTSSQYDDMARAIVIKYPYLGQGLPGTDAKNLWKNAIAHKVRNCRKRLDSDVPSVVERKRKSAPNSSSDPTQAARMKNQWGVQNFLPDRSVEEDDESILSHVNWLKVESRKSSKNLPKIDMLMEKTFADRRRLVVKEMISVTQMKEEYPCLFSSRQVLNEFEHLTNLRIEKLLLEGVAKYEDSILDTCKLTEFKRSVISSVAATKDPQRRSAIKAQGSLLLVPQLMGEKLDLLAVKKENMQPTLQHPLLTYQGEVLDTEPASPPAVIVEGIVLSEPTNIFGAVCEVLAAHYIFNIAYPKQLTRTLTFYQRIILNLQDTVPIPARVLNVTKKLNSYFAK